MCSLSADGSSERSVCACCGAAVPGGTEGCRRLFEEVLAREYSDLAWGGGSPADGRCLCAAARRAAQSALTPTT
jgi:hypothetical protein